MSFHTMIIVGHLGGDPVQRYTPSGQPVTSFSVAVNSGSGDDKKTGWFRVNTWGKQAETCNEYLHKGSKVLVEGKLQFDEHTGGPRVWKDQNGLMRASFEMTASTVRFLSPKDEIEEPANVGDAPDILSEEEIPF